MIPPFSIERLHQVICGWLQMAAMDGPDYTAEDAERAAERILMVMRETRDAPKADDSGVLIDDLHDLLDALGMGRGARPQSPHDVMREAIEHAKAQRKALDALVFTVSVTAVKHASQLPALQEAADRARAALGTPRLIVSAPEPA